MVKDIIKILQIRVPGTKSYLLNYFQKILMKNKSSLLIIRKIEKFQYLIVTTGEKKSMQNILFFKKIEESLKKVSDRSERKMALVVKGLHKWQVCLFARISLVLLCSVLLSVYCSSNMNQLQYEHLAPRCQPIGHKKGTLKEMRNALNEVRGEEHTGPVSS